MGQKVNPPGISAPPRRPEQQVLIPFAPLFIVLDIVDFIARRKEIRFSSWVAMFSATSCAFASGFLTRKGIKRE